jgi:hypothetical protein
MALLLTIYRLLGDDGGKNSFPFLFLKFNGGNFVIILFDISCIIKTV